MDGAADVAETTCTPWMVRQPTPGSQGYHGFITDRDGLLE